MKSAAINMPFMADTSMSMINPFIDVNNNLLSGGSYSNGNTPVRRVGVTVNDGSNGIGLIQSSAAGNISVNAAQGCGRDNL